MQAALRGAPKATIEHGLNHCSYHLWELSLQLTHPGRHMDKLASEIKDLQEGDLDRNWRKSFAQGMSTLQADIGSIMMAHQPDFEWNVVPPRA
jgi:hypothetical protein